MDLMLDRRTRLDIPKDADWIVDELIKRDLTRAELLICKVRTSQDGAAFLLIDKTNGAAIYTKEIAQWDGANCPVSKYVLGQARGLDYNHVFVEAPAGQPVDHYRLTGSTRPAVEPRIKDLVGAALVEHRELFKVSHWTERGFNDGNQWIAEVVDSTIGAVRIDSKMFFCQHNVETGSPKMLYNGWRNVHRFPASGVNMNAAKEALAKYEQAAPRFIAQATKQTKLTGPELKQAAADRVAALDKMLENAASLTAAAGNHNAK